VASGARVAQQRGDDYQSQIEAFTTFSRNAEQIHETGLKEVARISAEMETVEAQTGLQGDMTAFVKLLRTDPGFRSAKLSRRDPGPRSRLDRFIADGGVNPPGWNPALPETR
jgi:uncharacterized protein DUF885